MGQQSLAVPLVSEHNKKSWKRTTRALWILLAFTAIIFVGLILGGYTNGWVVVRDSNKGIGANESDIVESEHGVVAADDARCSEIGASILRQGGHAVDAAVATALCLGVVNPMASGIGGGGFMVVRSSATSKTQAFDMRETAPLAASQNMYESNPEAKLTGALSMGVPGEIAGLHEAWLQHGRMAWKTLFQPAIKLAKEGFEVAPYLGGHIRSCEEMIIKDPGLRQVYAPNGKMLKAGDMCYNVELGNSLESIAEQGPQAFYNGSLGEKIVKDVREAGGILTMEDLRTYKVNVTDAMTADVLGYTISGMPPPSAGTLGLSMGASGIIFLIIKGEGVRIRKMFIPGLYQHVTDLLFNVEIAMYINYFIDLINQIVGEGVRKMFFPGSVPAYYRSPVQCRNSYVYYLLY